MNRLSILITLCNGQTVPLELFGQEGTLFEISQEEAREFGEACYQLVEGKRYEYRIGADYRLKGEVVYPSQLNKSTGILQPGNQVGRLSLAVYQGDQWCGEVQLEVRSVKETYREDYRRMLEEITECSTELLMHYNSPVNQYFKPTASGDARILYQRFAFVKSLIDSGEFANAVHQILSSPATCWEENKELKSVCGVKRIDRQAMRQIACSARRINTPVQHPLYDRLKTLPEKIEARSLRETVDTPENRFVKYALSAFYTFCSALISNKASRDRLKKEGKRVVDCLGRYLNHAMLKQVGVPDLLPLNSPVLQRKEGYREILRVWLMFDLAAKLVWQGGEDVYQAGKRDVARLYEYWLFFRLLHLVEEVFQLKVQNLDRLIVRSDDGLALQLKQGQQVALAGVYECESRRLNIEFSYNRRFTGGKPYPEGGSWTLEMRPDYTLTIWPLGITQEQAEREELIVHLHFDAKYRLDKASQLFDVGNETCEDATECRKEDIWKMHAYRDAIRRSAGTYILYPGTGSFEKRGFHEILPGIGAFAINPTKYSQGVEYLKKFLKEVVEHFLNRTSQREKMAYRTYEIFKEKQPTVVKEHLPEYIGENRGLFPDETAVLVGFYKNEEHWDWIVKHKLYNVRLGARRGAIKLEAGLIHAKYVLLHTTGELRTSRLYRIVLSGPQIYSRHDLIRKHYPVSEKENGKEGFYLVYSLEEIKEPGLKDRIWDVSRLAAYGGRRKSAKPFIVFLTELIKVGSSR